MDLDQPAQLVNHLFQDTSVGVRVGLFLDEDMINKSNNCVNLTFIVLWNWDLSEIFPN